ncbi:MAG: phosphate ABC transporter substrate-binding protein PstS family protein [Actinomycetota bacterium]|nr:phosphate ABC transporter substrate-binding protein PstS family protein [Actinomycetota bacterium]
MSKRSRLVAAGVATLALVAAGCGGGAGGTGGGLTGRLFISGSSTVEPITALVAELFSEENPDVTISVEGPGTGDGFELFCNGETDISDASRTIQEEEIAACREAGIDYVELEVAIDGMAVMTSPQNAEVSCLNFGDLYALMGPESQGFRRWSDANELGEEVGGIAVPYPHQPLVVVAPGEESGTYDSFVEIAFADLAEEREQEESARPDYQASANDNVIIEGIAGSATSLGWVGYAFYEQNQEVVRAVEVDGGGGCTTPTTETIADGTYPLARSLYMYVNSARAAENEALRAFVDFYVTETGLQTAVERVGYVPLPPERQQATASAWETGRPT